MSGSDGWAGCFGDLSFLWLRVGWQQPWELATRKYTRQLCRRHKCLFVLNRSGGSHPRRMNPI